MAIDNISNATISLTDYKTEQKAQSAAAVQQAVKPAESNAVTTKTYTDKQDGAKEEEKRDAQTNANRLKSILNETNNKIKPTRTRCEFSYVEDVNRVSIKVMDVDTDKVIREIPPEETMEMLQKLWEVAGLLVDEKR
jgi:flagellar protein FlaG